MADKTLKSLNFGGADNYFPLPLVTTADNNKILSVVNGEWAAAEAPSGGSGQYVWSKHETENGKILEYVIGETEADYPDGGWKDGAWYKLKLAITPYLSFIGNEDFTLKTNNTTKNWDGALEYSTDKSTWNTWDGKAISSSGNNLYLRGIGNTKITGNPSEYRFVFTGTDALKIACNGNIENLLDYETVSAGGHPIMANYCYANMFLGCTSLTTAPSLPATTLADSCYREMFRGCTALTTAPSLPATTLVNNCYADMFSGCTSLTTAPELPATTLAAYCYWGMFYGCTALTTAPELPATTLNGHCYANMFASCTSLTTAPELPATTLIAGCYVSMFEGCTALTTAPSLPVTTLANSCYQNMFQGCTSLTTAPELPATTLTELCYASMFEGCTALTTAPELPATTLANYCYASMFEGCTALTTAPSLPVTTLANSCYRKMFLGCTSLTTAPELPATTLAKYCYQGMFNGCSLIKLSTTQTGAYTTAYRIPKSGTGRTAANALTDMFANTGGTFTGTPTINTTYYTSNTVV